METAEKTYSRVSENTSNGGGAKAATVGANKDYSQKGEELVDTAKDGLASYVTQAEEAFGAVSDEVSEALATAGKWSMETVRKYPIQTALVGVGVGIAIGSLFGLLRRE